MDLLGGNGYQDLLNDFIINEDLEITDLTVSDSLTLLFAEPSQNLVTNELREVITEDKDSFVDVSNQVTWSNVERAFTASLPQDIAISSIPTFGGLIINGQIQADDGSSSSPSYSFINDSDTGFYRAASGASVYSADGTNVYRSDIIGIRPSSNSTFSNGSNLLRWNIMYSDSMIVTNNITADTVNTGQGNNELYAMNQDVETTDAVTFLTVNTGQGNNELYAMNQDVETTDAVTFLTVNTGQGDNNLFIMDQNVRITDNVSFGTVNTGQGANELYAMDQDVQTTDSVSFSQLTIDNININLNTISTTSGNINISPTGSNNTRITSNHLRLVNTADAITPVYSFDGNVNMGIYPSATNELSFSTNSLQRAKFDTAGDLTLLKGLFLNNNNANRAAYLNNNKKLVGLNLGVDQVLTYDGTDIVAASISDLEGSMEMLNSTLDSNRRAATLTISNQGRFLSGSSTTAMRWAQCHESFIIPNTTGREIRFGFRAMSISGANLNIGFAEDSIDLTGSNLQTSIYAFNSSNNVYENGVQILNDPGFWTDGDFIEYLIRTNDKYRIFVNGEERFSSTNTIISATYFPTYGDSSATSSTFECEISPSVRLVDDYSETVSTGDILCRTIPTYSASYNGDPFKISSVNASGIRNLSNVTNGISPNNKRTLIEGFDETTHEEWRPTYIGNNNSDTTPRSRLFKVTSNGTVNNDFVTGGTIIPTGRLLRFQLRLNNSTTLVESFDKLNDGYCNFSLDAMVTLDEDDDILVRLISTSGATDSGKEFSLMAFSLTIVPMLNDNDSFQ